MDIDSSQLPAATYGCTTAAQPSHVTPLHMAAGNGQTEQNAKRHGYYATVSLTSSSLLYLNDDPNIYCTMNVGQTNRLMVDINATGSSAPRTASLWGELLCKSRLELKLASYY